MSIELDPPEPGHEKSYVGLSLRVYCVGMTLAATLLIVARLISNN